VLRASAAIVVSLTVAVLVCVQGIDYEPYYRTSYYEQTIQRFRVQAARAKVVTGELEAYSRQPWWVGAGDGG
jgi:hypothetical protein